MNTNNITYRGVHMKEEKKKNTTKYGEFVCSAYHWLPIEKQKEQALAQLNAILGAEQAIKSLLEEGEKSE